MMPPSRHVFEAGPNGAVELRVLRRDGHGFYGEFGVFQIQMSFPNYKADPLKIQYTSKGRLVDPNVIGQHKLHCADVG
jgi:hypothetical protein